MNKVMATDTKGRRKYDLLWKESELENQTDIDPNLAMPFTSCKLGRTTESLSTHLLKNKTRFKYSCED